VETILAAIQTAVIFAIFTKVCRVFTIVCRDFLLSLGIAVCVVWALNSFWIYWKLDTLICLQLVQK